MSTPLRKSSSFAVVEVILSLHPYPSLLLPSHTRCFMKIDHHCPWINVCVGHRNHAAFTRFVFYTPLGCLHASLVNANFLYRLFTGVRCSWSCCSVLGLSTLYYAGCFVHIRMYIPSYCVHWLGFVLGYVQVWLAWVCVIVHRCDKALLDQSLSHLCTNGSVVTACHPPGHIPEWPHSLGV